MSKTPVKFIKSHDRYNAGEAARFDALTAERLISAGVAIAYDAEAEAKTAAERAAAESAQARRAADLDAREAELVAREAALSAGSEAGAPPAQGGKK